MDDRKWNLKRQAELADKQMQQWPEWMKKVGHFAGSDPATSRTTDTTSKSSGDDQAKTTEK